MSVANSAVERVEAGWRELSESVAALGPDGLELKGPDGWAVKDHLVHVGAWEHSLLALLQGRDRLTAMGVPGVDWDTDAINQMIWERHHADPPQRSLEYFRDAHDSLIAALSNLSDADLQRPYNEYQPRAPLGEAGRRPAADWVAGNTWEHYAEHREWISALRR